MMKIICNLKLLIISILVISHLMSYEITSNLITIYSLISLNELILFSIFSKIHPSIYPIYSTYYPLFLMSLMSSMIISNSVILYSMLYASSS